MVGNTVRMGIQKDVPLPTWALQREIYIHKLRHTVVFHMLIFHPWVNRAAAGSLSLLDAGLATGH